MKKTSPKQQIVLNYDAVSLKTREQAETMLVAIHRTFVASLRAETMKVSSIEGDDVMMNGFKVIRITVELDPCMVYRKVVDCIEAMNTAVYLALNVDQRAEFFELAAKE